MDNPYAVTANQYPTSASDGRRSGVIPSVVLTLLTLLTILLESWLVAFPVTYFLATTIRDTPNFSFTMISGWGYIACGLLVFAAHWIILIGAICMWRNTSCRFAKLAMVLSIVPVFSPLFVLGIPFGIWGLISLFRSRCPTSLVPDHGVTMP